MTSEPRPNAFGQRIGVAVDAQHFLARVLAGGHRITGVRRVDEHQIEVLEPGLRIIGDHVRRRRHGPVVANHDAFRAERAKMQPYRRRARSAVEDEAHGSFVRRRVDQEIRRRENRRFRIAALVVESSRGYGDELRDRAIPERFALLHDAAFALARIAGKKLVDLLAQSLLRIVAGRRSRRRLAHVIDLVNARETRGSLRPAWPRSIGRRDAHRRRR